LEIINALILDEQYDEAIHSNEMLGKIFHYNLSSTKWVTVGEEINYSKQYLALIAYKTKDIVIEFDVANDVTNTKMLKLVLQPFIENAIIHGLRNHSLHKQLIISIHKKQKPSKRAIPKIEITIFDTGCGFNTIVLEELHKDFALIKGNKGFIEKPSIGIRNVYKRLYLEYGATGLEFDISNNIQGGSTIRISFPA
jgi:two-component system sensor histidine kinase YesM